MKFGSLGSLVNKMKMPENLSVPNLLLVLLSATLSGNYVQPVRSGAIRCQRPVTVAKVDGLETGTEKLTEINGHENETAGLFLSQTIAGAALVPAPGDLRAGNGDAAVQHDLSAQKQRHKRQCGWWVERS